MVKFQSNFTTSEQSKKLLELGVPADSADCCYENTWDGLLIYVFRGNESYSSIDEDEHPNIKYPCWSLGRLIEICKICCIKEKIYKQIKERIDLYKSMIDGLTAEIEFEATRGNMDFSKLEG